MVLTLAEEKVRKLARLPSNCICPICLTEKKFGFSTICVKYLTFVCNECKTSHQAISHRCKSLTMSSWSDHEVDVLAQQGGNDACRNTWLAKAPPPGVGGRPKPGDDIGIFKRFIVDAYEKKKYYGEATVSVGRSTTAAAAAAAAAPPPAHPFAGPTPPRAMKTVPAPATAPLTPAPAPPSPMIDLLDFSSPQPPTAAPPNTPAVGVVLGDFDALAPKNAAVAAISMDPFAPSASFSLAPKSSVDLFGPAAATSAATSSQSPNDFAAFASSGFDFVGAPTPSPAKKPIMGGSGNGAISSMDWMAAPPQPQRPQQPMTMNFQNGGMNFQQQQQQPTMMMMMNGMSMNFHQPMMNSMNPHMMNLNGTMNPHQQPQPMMMMNGMMGQPYSMPSSSSFGNPPMMQNMNANFAGMSMNNSMSTMNVPHQANQKSLNNMGNNNNNHTKNDQFADLFQF